MRLSEFIRHDTEAILADFEAFARSLVPAGTMDIAALRDHAKAILKEIAHDVETPQTSKEARAKSKGHSDADVTDATADTAAQEHGSGRAESGFSVQQMVSEYRALRASVIRLWTKGKAQLDHADVEDLMRFNEAIDQALAESTVRFMDSLDQTRETFLAMLGHDLRSPLGAIITSAQFMQEMGDLTPAADTLAGRIVSSGVRMNHMVDDLLDFTRTQLGSAIPIKRAPVDLETLLMDAVNEIKASRPDTEVSLETTGNLAGEFDSGRMSQVFSNLLVNARSHGSSGTPITVMAHGGPKEIVLSVHNQGPPISSTHIQSIFEPLSGVERESRDPAHLGLGLYISKQIVLGHGGHIDVESTAAGTTFTVHLPRP
jgi:signal transduction histidine kinase